MLNCLIIPMNDLCVYISTGRGRVIMWSGMTYNWWGRRGGVNGVSSLRVS